MTERTVTQRWWFVKHLPHCGLEPHFGHAPCKWVWTKDLVDILETEPTSSGLPVCCKNSSIFRIYLCAAKFCKSCKILYFFSSEIVRGWYLCSNHMNLWTVLYVCNTFVRNVVVPRKFKGGICHGSHLVVRYGEQVILVIICADRSEWSLQIRR